MLAPLIVACLLAASQADTPVVATVSYSISFADSCTSMMAPVIDTNPAADGESPYTYTMDDKAVQLDKKHQLNNTHSDKGYVIGNQTRDYPLFKGQNAGVTLRLSPVGPDASQFNLLIEGEVHPANPHLGQESSINLIQYFDKNVRCGPAPVDCALVCAQIVSIP
eukprot:TRINITY_DN9284_c0_g1_i1.p1 TRINITY_DN9284_c0_g1~~TRINITY_DN9284_c0_g1_i1.p1  ORF type:complete len:165 (-),score=49.43 TRINITY_DN9284_c0_g1_i1:62-556(-)